MWRRIRARTCVQADAEKTSRAKAKEYERLKNVKSALSKREVELTSEMRERELRLEEAETEVAQMKKHHAMVTAKLKEQIEASASAAASPFWSSRRPDARRRVPPRTNPPCARRRACPGTMPWPWPR